MWQRGGKQTSLSSPAACFEKSRHGLYGHGRKIVETGFEAMKRYRWRRHLFEKVKKKKEGKNTRDINTEKHK